MILHLCTANDDHMFGSWDIEHNRQNFLPFRAILCPFTPITTQKIKILKIWKKTPGGLIILNMSTINENHIMYESWDMEHDRQNFFSFWTIFCPFTPSPPNNPENQNFEKMKKKRCGYHHFTQVYNKWQSYDIWFLRYEVHQTGFFFHLAPFFALLPPYQPEKWKCQKNEKMPGYIIILHKCTKHYDHRLFLRYGTW